MMNDEEFRIQHSAFIISLCVGVAGFICKSAACLRSSQPFRRGGAPFVEPSTAGPLLLDAIILQQVAELPTRPAVANV